MPTAGIGISPAVATIRDTPNTLERASHGTPTAPAGADVVRIGDMMVDTYYIMSDAELLEVRKGIQASLDEPSHAEQKEKGIADKWNSADGLNELASCTLALKNRIYPWLVDFDIIEAIANYGYGLTDGRKDAVNLGYRVLSKWLKDHGMDKPKVVNGIHNREQNLRDILDGMGGWIRAENMNGYTRIVPPDRKRRKQANQPAPPAIDAYRVWWMLLNGGSEVRVYTPDDAEPMNLYKGLVGLDMGWFTIPEPEPEPEPEPPPMAVYCGPLPHEVYDYRRSLRGRALLAEFRKAGYKSKTAGRALIKAVGGQNIHLYGKQGTGKSNTPKDIAEFLGLPRVVIGFNSMAELVIGYLDVNGNQVWTPFLKAITSPCILQFDENDRQTDDVQDALLGILSDGYMTLANGTCIHRHPMCYLIATGNHPLQYPHTREAYGDRFRQIETVYEPEIARDIVKDCGELGTELVEFLEDFEKQRVAQELDGAQVSYRPLVRMIKDLMSDDGDTLQQIISENLIQGALDAEQCKRIGMNMRVHNQFTDALMKM